MKDTNLWMDSSDFSLTGKRKISKRSLDWSFKNNSPGRRFMVLMDGSLKIVGLWGPYAPKLHDGAWLELYRKELESDYEGAVIVADNHFSVGRKFKKIKFYVPHSKNELIYASKKQFNKDCRRIRQIIEDPFGIVKSTFKNLDKPFSKYIIY